MSWVRLDDQLPDHPKIVAAGPMASWLYICSLAYAARYLTDGFIPAGAVHRLVDLENTPALAEQLVSVGLWDVTPGGYHIHDYLEYNPSAERVKADRTATATRVNDWRDKKRVARAASNASVTPLQERLYTVGNGVSNAVVTPPPSPAPTPITTLSVPAPNTPEPMPENVDNFTPFFDTFWATYPPRNGKRADKAKTKERLRRWPIRDHDRLLLAVEHYARSTEATRGYARDPLRFLAGDYWLEWETPEPPAAKNGAHPPREPSDGLPYVPSEPTANQLAWQADLAERKARAAARRQEATA